MIVIKVSGSVRHIRPLPSDSTTPSVPVFAIPKFAPADRHPGGQELAPQVLASRSRQRRRLVCERRINVGHLTQEDLPDLGPIPVDRRHQNVRGLVVAKLHDQLGEIGF
jgi:hypothetical protein